MQEDYECILELLKQDMVKGKGGEQTMLLLKELLPNRRKMLKECKTRPMNTLIEMLPGFGKAHYVREIYLAID